MRKLHLFRFMLAAFALVATTAALSSCSDDKDDDFVFPTLEVTPTELSFDENGGTKTFDIKTEGKWTITGADDESWLAITPARQGSGNQQITVTVAAAAEAHSAELTITCFGTYYGIDKEMDSKKVKITQTKGGETPSDEEFYYNNFDKEEATKTYGPEKNSYPYLDQFEGWMNQTGTGIANVKYEYEGMSTRSNSTSDSDYSDYEGSGMNNLFFGNGGTFTIKEIAVNTPNLCLTFGTERYLKNQDNTFKVEDLPIQLSADGVKWSAPIEYGFPSSANTNGRWNLATANFTLPEGTTTLYIRWSTKVASAHRIDDVRLKGGVGGQQITFDGGGETPSGEEKAITIPEIIAALSTSEAVLDAEYDRVFEAVVVTDKAGGNVNNNNLQVMTPDATEPGNGITLFGSGITNPNDEAFAFAKGDHVKVTLKAGLAKIVNYSGLYEVTGGKGETWVTIEKIGTKQITPVVIAAKDLAAYQGMVVTLNDMTAPSTAAVWCEEKKYGQHTFTTGGENVTVFVQSGMPGLVNTQFIAGATGSVTGYATVYKNNAQICPQTPSDVAAFASKNPAISALTPSSLTFVAEGATQTIEVATVNTDDSYTIQASADNAHFQVNVSGKTISVTAPANETGAPITATLKVELMKDGSAVDTKTAELSQTMPVSGNVVTLTNDEIKSSMSNQEYGDFNFTNAFGNWTGKCRIQTADPDAGAYVQMNFSNVSTKSAFNSHILVPELKTKALQIEIKLAVNTTSSRAIGVYPTDYSYAEGVEKATHDAAALAMSDKTTQQGSATLTIDVSSLDLKQFSLFPSSDGAVYIESITIVCAE